MIVKRSVRFRIEGVQKVHADLNRAFRKGGRLMVVVSLSDGQERAVSSALLDLLPHQKDVAIKAAENFTF